MSKRERKADAAWLARRIKGQPEKLHELFVWLAVDALREALPCK